VRDTLVLDDPAAAGAERIAAAVSAGGHIALAGGSTPRAAYERVAAIDLDWSRSTLWFGDERCVPPDDGRSNFGMVRAALLDRLGAPGPAVRRIAGELGPWRGADAYEAELRDELGGVVPALDLVLLGIGPDAHCASLFPGQAALDERARWIVGVEHAGLAPWVPRVTMTLPVINAAREIVFLVTGPDKANAVARAFAGDPSRSAPASLVAPSSGSLTVLLDPAAAARLPADEVRGR
jgi:6-phosphogluconolactonase